MTALKTTFTGDTKQLERAILKTQTDIDKLGERISKSNRASALRTRELQAEIRGIGTATTDITAALGRLAPAFAAAFSATEVIRLADAYTSFQAKLINAGVAAENMAATQEKLFTIAKANGTEIVSIGELYGSLSTATSDLGTSQSDLIKITEGVAAALKLSGGGAAQASSVILQLSQAIAGGKLQAAEYNSIIDASPALIKGLAEAIPGLNGSIGKLREAMLDGKLGVDVLIPALTRMSDEMVNKAAKAPLTISAAFQNLQTSLVQYVGQSDQSLGASAALTAGLRLLGDNLDTVADSLMVITAFIAARGVGAMVNYTGSVVGAQVASARLAIFNAGMTASLTGVSRSALLATSAMRGLSGAMAFFGGPIGLAITGIALAIFAVSSRMAELERRTKELPAAFSETESKIAEYKQAQLDAASATAEAAKASRDRAAALREETQALINKRRVDTQDAIDRATKAVRSAERYEGAAAKRRAGANNRQFSNASTAQDFGAEQQARGARALADQLRAEANLQINGLRSLEQKFEAPPVAQTVTATPTPNTKATGGASGGSGPDADDVSRNSTQLSTDASRRLAELETELANTAQARHDLALKRLEWEREDADKAVEKQLSDKQITAAAAAEAKLSNQTILTKSVELANAERARDLEEERINAVRAAADSEANIARILDATARNHADTADTLADRNRIEREAFNAYQIAEKAALEARHEEARARERLTGAINAEAERRRVAEANAFGTFQQSERGVFDESQRQTNPFAKYVDAAKDIDTSVISALADGVGEFEDGIVSAIMQTKNLGDAFK